MGIKDKAAVNKQHLMIFPWGKKKTLSEVRSVSYSPASFTFMRNSLQSLGLNRKCQSTRKVLYLHKSRPALLSSAAFSCTGTRPVKQKDFMICCLYDTGLYILILGYKSHYAKKLRFSFRRRNLTVALQPCDPWKINRSTVCHNVTPPSSNSQKIHLTQFKAGKELLKEHVLKIL